MSHLALLAAVLMSAGCATFGDRSAQLERHLASGNYAAASEALARIDFAPRDEALMLLNRGMLARLRGDYRGSNADFEAAKQRMDELSKLSLREEALAATLAEQARAYAGQPFERLLLLVFKALNYLALGEHNGARVEALQIDLLLRELAGSGPETAVPGAALARYVSGLIYELRDERSDAFIAYRRAADSYAAQGGRVPLQLQRDLRRLAAQLGRQDDVRDLPAAGATDAGERLPFDSGSGELIVVVTGGMAPALRENAVVVPELVSGRLMRIALPVVVPRGVLPSAVRVEAGPALASAEPIEDITRLLRADLEKRLPGMTARMVARQVVKSQAVRQIGKAAMERANDSGERLGAGLLMLGAEITALVSERADTRSWLTLPGVIMLVRLPLPPGTHQPRLLSSGRYNDGSGGKVMPPVELAPGRRVLRSVHLGG